MERSSLPIEPTWHGWGVRNGRLSLLGFAGAGDTAAQACSLGLVGLLDCLAQAYSDGWTCEKTIQKRYARQAAGSEHLALFAHAPSSDMF